MANQMTAREQRFAALLLETTKVDAYKRAGYSEKGSRATQTVDAYRLSKRPKVQREVARLLQQRAFPADDYKRIQETVVAGLTEMFLHDPDSRLRLKVGEALLSYADVGLKLHPAKGLANDSSDRAIIAEVRTLYAKAGLTGPVEDAGIKHRHAMERGPEQALIVEPAEEGEPLVEVAAEAELANAEDEAPEPGETARVEVSLGTEKLDRAGQFRMERIPGHFGPARYRRVRVEP